MRHTLRKSEILRGKKKFQEVFDHGKKIEGNILRCLVLKNSSHEVSKNINVSVAFAVPRTVKRAIDRNRIRRLMRESYRLNKEIVFSQLDSFSDCLSIVFLFSPAKRLGTRLPGFSETEEDMKLLLSSIARMDRT